MSHTCLTYVASLWKRTGIYLLSFVDVIDSVPGIVMMFAIDVPLSTFKFSLSCLRLGVDRLSHAFTVAIIGLDRSVRPRGVEHWSMGDF